MRRKLAFESLCRLQFEALEDRRVLATSVVDGPALYDSIDPQAATVRAAAAWPFSSDSPYNTSIGSAAAFATISSPAFSSSGGAALNMQQWSIPVFVSSPSDPVRSFYRGTTLIASGIHTPDSATPDSQSDGTLVVIDGTKAIEMWQASKRSDGNWTASQTVVTDLSGSNVYTGYHGIRAGGMSVLGGLIRTDELANLDIEHALAVAVDRSGLNKMVGGQAVGFVWPASWADGTSTPGANYGTTGNLHMGSLLAIPPSVNINNLGLSAQGLALAKAMQNYGAYIVETGSTNIAYYAEPAAASVAERGLGSQLAKLTPYLQVVTNNGPNSVGGGGTHLPAAPPIGDPTAPPAATYNVSGIVTGTNGVALSGAQVALAGGSTVTTNGQGQYSFGSLAAGDYTINVSATGYNSQSAVAHVTTNNIALNFALSAIVAPPPVVMFVISGVVRGANGVALSGAQVTLAGGPTVTTNVQGQYSFSNLAAGGYTIGVSATGYNSQTVATQISTNNVTLDFSLSPVVAPPPAATYSVSGIVTRTNGVALSGARRWRLLGDRQLRPMRRANIHSAAWQPATTLLPSRPRAITRKRPTPTLRRATSRSTSRCRPLSRRRQRPHSRFPESLLATMALHMPAPGCTLPTHFGRALSRSRPTPRAVTRSTTSQPAIGSWQSGRQIFPGRNCPSRSPMAASR